MQIINSIESLLSYKKRSELKVIGEALNIKNLKSLKKEQMKNLLNKEIPNELNRQLKELADLVEKFPEVSIIHKNPDLDKESYYSMKDWMQRLYRWVSRIDDLATMNQEERLEKYHLERTEGYLFTCIYCGESHESDQIGHCYNDQYFCSDQCFVLYCEKVKKEFSWNAKGKVDKLINLIKLFEYYHPSDENSIKASVKVLVPWLRKFMWIAMKRNEFSNYVIEELKEGNKKSIVIECCECRDKYVHDPENDDEYYNQDAYCSEECYRKSRDYY